MEQITPEVTYWDVPLALRDVCVEMFRCHSAGESADPATVRHWHEWLFKAARAHKALAVSCEDIVEGGATPENLAAMRAALAQAMGQETYWPRADRW